MAILAFSSNNIFDSTSAGRALLTAADASAQRTLLGLSSSSAVSFQSLVLSGQSLTGSTATSVFDATTTWNTTGTPTAISLNVTDTASNANSLLFRLQTGGITQFSVRKDGRVDFKGNSVIDQNGSAFLASLVINGGKADFSGTYLANTIQIKSTFAYAWNSADANTSSVDLFLYRDAANTLAQRNGVNPQTFRVYNTFTDISNYERAKIAWSSNVLQIGTEKLGTGVARGVAIQVDGTTRIDIPTSGDIYITPIGTTDSFRFGPNNFKYLTSGGSIANCTFTMGAISMPFSNVAVGGTAGASTNSPSFSVTRTQTADVAASINNFITTFNTPASSVQAQNSVTVSTTVNQGAGSTGITRGLYVAPTLTSATDWRSIETSNNTGYSFYGAGTAPSYFGGNVGIGVAPSSFKLHIRHTGGDFIRLGISAANADTLDGGISWYTNEAVTADYFGGLRMRFVGGTADGNRQMQFLVGDLVTPKVTINGDGSMVVTSWNHLSTYDCSNNSANGVSERYYRYGGNNGAGSAVLDVAYLGGTVASPAVPVNGRYINSFCFRTGGTNAVLFSNPSFTIRHTISGSPGGSLSPVDTSFLVTSTADGIPNTALELLGQSASVRIPLFLRIGTSGSESILISDAANVLAQRNGVNAQTFNIYNTYTDASNYERWFVKWSGNTLQIGNEAAGTGSQRNLQIWTGGSARITVDTIGRVGIANATPAAFLHVGSGISLSVPDGAGSTLTPQVLHTDTSGKVAIACGVNDGTNNRRIALFMNQTDAICGIGATWSAGSIPFVITLGGLERVRIDTSGNAGIGTNNSLARLHVKGSGNTSATFGINLEDSAGTHVFRVRDDGGIHIGPTTAATNGAFISASDGTDNNGTTTGSGLRYRSSLTISSTGSDHLFRNYQGSRTGTSGTSNLMEMNGGFAPTSGTGVYNFVRVVGTINQTGGSTGITRGIWVSPTLTAAADFRAIETENGSWRLNDTYAAGSGSLSGSAMVINQTWNTTGTPTAIKLNVTDTASNASSLLMDLLVGGTSVFNVNKAGIATVTDRLAFSTVAAQPRLRRLGNALDVVSNDESAFSVFRAGELWLGSSLALVLDASDILAQRRGVIAQAFRIYNTFTNSSNYERAKIAWESNVLRIGTENAGTGSARAFELQTNGLTQFTIAANGIITTTNGINVGSSSNSITNASANGTGTERVFACSQAYAAIAGSRIIFSSTNSVQPTSGTLTYTGVGISPTINQTGGANGITRGIHINPTLTAAADWRAIEITAGKTIVAPSTTTSASLNIPSGTAPTSPVDGDIWFDGTALKIRIGGVTKTVTVT